VAGQGDGFDTLLLEQLSRLLKTVQGRFQAVGQIHEGTDIVNNQTFFKRNTAAVQHFHKLDELPADDGRAKKPFAVENKMTINNADKKFLLVAHLKEGRQLFAKALGIGDYLRMAGEIQPPVGNSLAEQDDNIINFLIHFRAFQVTLLTVVCA